MPLYDLDTIERAQHVIDHNAGPWWVYHAVECPPPPLCGPVTFRPSRYVGPGRMFLIDRDAMGGYLDRRLRSAADLDAIYDEVLFDEVGEWCA